jgi:hypothetical protein
MFKSLCSFVTCVSALVQPVQEQEYLEYPINSLYPPTTLHEYKITYTKYSPMILAKYGKEIEAFIAETPGHEKAQFISRYLQVITHKLNVIPVEHRDTLLQSIIRLTPAHEVEHNYIHHINLHTTPPAALQIGEDLIYWPARHHEIEDKIQAIKAELQRK